MGFDEDDFDALINNNIFIAKNRPMFSESKLIKMAGNSIVVNVLQAIFIQINDIKEMLFKEDKALIKMGERYADIILKQVYGK